MYRGLAVAQAIFSSVLANKMNVYAPTAPIGKIKENPLSIYALPTEQIQPVIKVYMQSLRYCVPFSLSAILLSLCIINIKITHPPAPSPSSKPVADNDLEILKGGDGSDLAVVGAGPASDALSFSNRNAGAKESEKACQL
ncbi:hypothetical protein OIV83_003106 [Microbotryomycetes sp. JL201]|nr:hypothetical protein OIV83_003106 [Microbotryomycetes sp. JL201]